MFEPAEGHRFSLIVSGDHLIGYRIARSLFIIWTVAFFILASNAVRAEEPPSVPGPRDAYVSSSIGDARILIPFFADDTSSAAICGLIYNGLTKVDKDLSITGDLAESWDVSGDGLEIIFHLRKGVQWHDGEPFTAEDVKFTYDKILDPSTGSAYISSYSDITGIQARDDHTVVFRYSRPYSPALSKFGMGIIPSHIFSAEDNIRSSPYARRPIGTGPYVFSRWDTGQYIVLDAFGKYFEGEPGIKRYVSTVIPDQSVQFLELVSGGIDSMELNPYQYVYRSDTPGFRQKIDKFRYLSHSYSYIGYNLEDPILGDIRVRRALSYAIDRRQMIDSVLLGLGEECSGPFLKGTPFYDPSVEGYEYDPDKAAKLLRQAGWVDTDGDGVLEKGDMEFRIKLATNQGNQVREDAATVVQSQWEKVGVKAQIQVVAWSAFLDQFINKRNFQAVLLGWTIPVDPDIFSVWHSDSAVQGGLNFISLKDAELDALIEDGRREFDPGKRAGIYKKAHRRINELAPYTFLYFPQALPAVNRRFKGIEPASAGIGYNFIDWYVPEDEVKYKF